ncbi:MULTISPECIES: aminodeoxychorismate synthase component I [Streptomyces]|uniref:aminodeoxychorismate synthase component I n=1 Tax=Streptomyces TaxID=1883 RepID=UPI00163C33AA|nr:MULTISPECIES: aminodeoxychorismate synthase component I [Streptomyces]MBC2876328.1 aminodeoxychorismate synthase component I [Streptomyces sp. TYQ1024]UBI35455.1 aminodeoxychorismate synthase component I [Streptomyces mobaraensis]UKW28047.1 aminodeoxychorismate synthase component I [Streptomyces sp. TYQ1024]
MRTLLVDNYDSFTYNLFHYLAEVNGTEPVVLRNDDPCPSAGELREFDNVVISPGPGTPERPGDFGICREIVEHGRLPLLGVCLGHQGICHLAGATVRRAPEVRHGRVSPVLHGGTDVFAGLPSPFDAVRYHSLAVTDLPPELEALATTPDGVLMGVRHRDRPLWGVQFHPESVCTEHGHLLLRNFRDLTADWHWRTGRPRPALRRALTTPDPAPRPALTTPDPAPRPAKAPGTSADGPRWRVLAERIPTRVADEVVFDRLFRRSRHAFWLDSSATDASLGRFSAMGDAEGPLARVVSADVWHGTVTVTSANGVEIVGGPFFDWLDRDLAARHVDVPDLPFEFTLGWVGYLGYELKAECGGDRAHRSPEPDAVMIYADRAVVFDHLTSTTHLLALAAPGDERPARAWLDRTRAELARLAGRRPDPAPAPQRRLSAPRLRHDRDAYLAAIDTCQDAIGRGETYEVCLTNMLCADGTLVPWDAYRFLRRTSPAPFGALLLLDSLAVLSTSPERFLRVSASGLMESKPIKGTRPRGGTSAEDALLREDLRTSEKDRAENLMIVDLVRNDLGRCAEVGSVHVPELFAVETYATVHQLVSTVRARLRPGRSAVDCVRAAFPGGSMTGAPKIRTMRLIDELEAGPRGVYSGAIGYLSLSGAADLSIVIRTAVAAPGRVSYGVGGAIVALSDPAAEFEETAVKATPLLRLLGAGFPGRRPAVTG